MAALGEHGALDGGADRRLDHGQRLRGGRRIGDDGLRAAAEGLQEGAQERAPVAGLAEPHDQHEVAIDGNAGARQPQHGRRMVRPLERDEHDRPGPGERGAERAAAPGERRRDGGRRGRHRAYPCGRDMGGREHGRELGLRKRGARGRDPAPGERRAGPDRVARERDDRVERLRHQRPDRDQRTAAVAGLEQLRLGRDGDRRAPRLERAERIAAGRGHDRDRERRGLEVTVGLRLVERGVECARGAIERDRQRPRRPERQPGMNLATPGGAQRGADHPGGAERAAPAELQASRHQTAGS